MKISLLLGTGLCAAMTFSAFSQKPLIVGTIQANMRENPAATAKVIGKVKRGTVLQASTYSGAWVYVVYGTLRGWVHASVLRIPGENIVSAAQSPSVKFTNFSTKYEDTWTRFESSVDGTEWFNAGTATRSGSIVTLWWKTVDKTTLNNVAMMQIQIDCSRNQSRTLAGVKYYAGGQSKGSWNTPSTWSVIFPETVLETLKGQACAL